MPEGNAALFKAYFDARISEKPDARVLLVSHMPLVSFLVEAFTLPDQAPIFSTGQLACIDYRPGVSGRLLERLSPQELSLLSVLLHIYSWRSSNFYCAPCLPQLFGEV